jgi:hypothetical protein
MEILSKILGDKTWSTTELAQADDLVVAGLIGRVRTPGATNLVKPPPKLMGQLQPEYSIVAQMKVMYNQKCNGQFKMSVDEGLLTAVEHMKAVIGPQDNGAADWCV